MSIAILLIVPGAPGVDPPSTMDRYVLASVTDAGARPSGMTKMKFLGSMAPRAAVARVLASAREVFIFDSERGTVEMR